MAYNDINDENYKSLSGSQGTIFKNQKNNFFENDNRIETIEINSSTNEGFTNIREGFHEDRSNRLDDTIEQMTKWMRNKFDELEKLDSEYKSVKDEYDRVSELLSKESLDYFGRTSKNNEFSGKNVTFRDGEKSYITNKGVIRDYDPQTYLETHFKNDCNRKKMDVDVSRDELLESSQVIKGDPMSMKRMDVQVIRLQHYNNYLHVSEVELFDSDGRSLTMPVNEFREVSVHLNFMIKHNPSKSPSDKYGFILTYNGKDVSDTVYKGANTLPYVAKKFPKNHWYKQEVNSYNRGLSNNAYGMNRNVPFSTKKLETPEQLKNPHGMHVYYYTQTSCHKWSPKHFLGAVRHTGKLYFNWRNGYVKEKYHDHMSVSFEGYIKAPATGSYQFIGYSDDGSQFGINDRNGQLKAWRGLHYNHGWSNMGGRYKVTVDLVKDQYYRFHYHVRECGGWVNIGLYWTTPLNRNMHFVPGKYFYVGTPKGGITFGGTPARTSFDLNFKKVTSPFNGIRIDPGKRKNLRIQGGFLIAIKRGQFDKSKWMARDKEGINHGIFINSGAYGQQVKITDHHKISFAPFNPFVYKAYLWPNKNPGWGGHPHYPLDGSMGSTWPNSVHSPSWKGTHGYDIVLEKTSDVDKIIIRNRTDAVQNRLNKAKLQLLNGNGKVVKEYNLDGSMTQTFYTKGGPRGTSCGHEGSNVMVTEIPNIGDDEFIGCFKDSGNRRMKWQGKWGTYEECKQFAIDNNAPYFGLQASNPNRDIHACMFSKDLNKTISYGERKRGCPIRPYSKRFGPVGSGWTNAVYSLDNTNFSKIEEKANNITNTITEYSNVNAAKCLNYCELNSGCSAIEYDENYRKRIGLKPLNVGGNVEDKALALKNSKIDKFLNLTSYDIVSYTHLGANHGNWRNIFHYGNSNVERAPAMWFYPNIAHYWKIHFRIRTTRSWNDGWDFMIPRRFRKFNIKLKIHVRISDVNTDKPFIQAWINNKYCGRGNLYGRRIVKLPNRNFWIKDPWHIKWGFAVNSIVFKDTYGRYEKGLCQLKSGVDLNQKTNSQTEIYNKVQNRPFENGIANLGKIGYVDEKGILHEYPKNMIIYENNWSVKKDTYSGHAKDIGSMRKTSSVAEAKRIANADTRIAAFIRTSDGRTWMKSGETWPLNPLGSHQYSRGVDLYYKTKSFRVPQTCNPNTSKITSDLWENYDKGENMNDDYTCGLANYTDSLVEQKSRASNKLNLISDKMTAVIKEINDANSQLAPTARKENQEINSIVSRMENIKKNINFINRGRDTQLGFSTTDESNTKEGMTNLTSNLDNYHYVEQKSETEYAIMGLLGITGLILGASYLTKNK